MTTLRILNIICWGAMVLYMLPAAFSAVRGKAVRRGDPMRLACALTGVVMIAFTARWLVAPDDQTIWATLYVVSSFLAIYILRLGRAYGRGGHVGD